MGKGYIHFSKCIRVHIPTVRSATHRSIVNSRCQLICFIDGSCVRLVDVFTKGQKCPDFCRTKFLKTSIKVKYNMPIKPDTVS